jgi:hypothetical protein
LCGFCAFYAHADIKIIAPENGACVSQLYPVQARLVGETMAQREIDDFREFMLEL